MKDKSSNATGMECLRCRSKHELNEVLFKCSCGGPLDIKYDYKKVRQRAKNLRKDRIVSHWKYEAFYPVRRNDAVSLGEGGTPLLKSLVKYDCELFFKNEGTNPTGSFKDRGSSIEITRALQTGAREVVCATTGNMGASVAAYSSKAGIKSFVFAPRGTSPKKISKIKAYGGEMRIFGDTYGDALRAAESKSRFNGYYVVGDYQFRREGQKSVGFEIIDQLEWKAPDYVIVPMGNGNLICAVWKAMKELKICGLVKKLPRLVGVQAKGCDPIVRAFLFGGEIKPVRPKTIADAVACGDPIEGPEALSALKESKGAAIAVPDKEMLSSVRMLKKEGLSAEPAAASSLAAFLNLYKEGIFGGRKVVALITGNGLKLS